MKMLVNILMCINSNHQRFYLEHVNLIEQNKIVNLIQLSLPVAFSILDHTNLSLLPLSPIDSLTLTIVFLTKH